MKANIFKILLLKPIFLILANTPWSRRGLVMVQRVARSSGVQCSVLPSDTLSVNPEVTFFESGKDKAAKRQGWGPPSFAVPKTHRNSNPICHYH